jgi:Bardet-Biedl syndrome 7 protein
MDSHLEDASWQNNLALLHPLIQEQHMIAKKNQLIDGLKELQL